MSDAITLSEVQEFVAGFWYHYDQGHFDELAARIGDEMEYLSRSDSGACPFEELLAAELHGGAETLAWLIRAPQREPLPAAATTRRTSFARAATERSPPCASISSSTRSPTTSRSRCPAVSSTSASAVATDGLVFTSMSVVLDAEDSIPFAEHTRQERRRRRTSRVTLATPSTAASPSSPAPAPESAQASPATPARLGMTVVLADIDGDRRRRAARRTVRGRRLRDRCGLRRARPRRRCSNSPTDVPRHRPGAPAGQQRGHRAVRVPVGHPGRQLAPGRRHQHQRGLPRHSGIPAEDDRHRRTRHGCGICPRSAESPWCRCRRPTS